MQHFFLSPSCFQKERVQISEPELLHQFTHVLRMREGDRFIALDGSGFEYLCTVEILNHNCLEAKVLEKKKNEAEPEKVVILYQALPKKMELFEWVLQKGTEIGVSGFVPIITARGQRQEIPKPERLTKILKEAAEQSERGIIPQLNHPQKFSDAISGASGKIIVFHSRGGEKFSEKLTANQKEISVFVGPEGGFADEEIETAKGHGCTIVSLGPRILRTETAGIAAASLLLLR